MECHAGPWLFVLMAFCCQLAVSAAPQIMVRSALKMPQAPVHENLGTKNQAMGVWKLGNGTSARELVVALVHQYNNLDYRADDKEFGIVWESDGRNLKEVMRVPMSCPNVELIVPKKGPYMYEARLDASPFMLHPECSCSPQQTTPCTPGVLATIKVSGSDWSLTSPTNTHFVQLQNEWGELIGDPAVLGRLAAETKAPVQIVSREVIGAQTAPGADPIYGCPGSRDDDRGNQDVTFDRLKSLGLLLPPGHVQDRWCLVKRGYCSETAKVKVCELSGAVGTIIVDHGMLSGDQEIKVQYMRAAGEKATKPVLFISFSEGEALKAEIQNGGVSVTVGPAVGGPPPPSYHPGSGIVVHSVGPSSSTYQNKSYPDLFATVGWLESSSVRDLLFVCLPALAEIRIYDIAEPLKQMPMVGAIQIACSNYGLHDYRVLDYVGHDGRYRTLLIDPADRGNRLYYFDTQNPSNPKFILELHATFEAESDGLGQVQPGGPGGRYHIMTWHCSDLYCGKSHGDNIYFLDSWNLTNPAQKVALPMLSKGSYARDLQCGLDGICLVSLTWDGFVALDSGAAGTVNQFSVIASHVGAHPFSTSYVPLDQAHLRMYSGAQKVYSSQIFPRTFYIEHADFDLRPLKMGDVVRALQMNEIYLAEIAGYDPSVAVESSEKPTEAGSTVYLGPGFQQDGTLTVDGGQARQQDQNRSEDGTVHVSLVVILAAFTATALVLVGILLCAILCRMRQHSRMQDQLQMAASRAAEAGQPQTAGSDSVVVGRPVGPQGGVAPSEQPHKLAEDTSWQKTPVGVPSVVAAPARSPNRGSARGFCDPEPSEP